jgi:murein DD-endopeptidase MepM/ murein hydrolase activator NlpD
MLWPAPGRLTSRYGYREHPIYGDRRFHAGIDIGGGLGARVSAAESGIVTYAGYASGYGTLVVISHGTRGGRDVSTAYAHMGRLTVREGESLDRGEKVGEIGSEGNSTGPHLHFEVRLNGDPVDPLDYVDPP